MPTTYASSQASTQERPVLVNGKPGVCDSPYCIRIATHQFGTMVFCADHIRETPRS